MGNTKSNNKIPAVLCEPTYHIYSDTGAWDVSILKKLVVDGRLAPFYPPVSDAPPLPANNNTTNSTISTITQTNNQSSHRKRSTSSSTPDRKSSILSRFQTILHVNNNDNQQQHNQQTSNDNSNEPQPPRPLEEYYDECPICMMYYQGGMNVAKCCSQRICSECVIQICKQGPKYAETSSVCPFCKACPFKIDYKGPKPWSQRCRELEEEQAVIQLKIRHQQDEDKQQEEDRRKRLESSNSLNNSQQDASVLSNSTRNTNTNTSFTSTTTTTNTLSNNNSFSSPTISTPSTQTNPVSGISFLETYFANRRLNEQQPQQPQQPQTGEEISNNSVTPTSATYSTQNQDDDTYFRFMFSADRNVPSSPTRSLQNAFLNRLQNRFFIEDDGDEDNEEEHDYLGYYLAGNRSPVRRPAGPISNNNSPSRLLSTRTATASIPTSLSATIGGNNSSYGTISTPTNNRNIPQDNNEHVEGLPTFSDFIPTSIDVTNVSADEEMLSEAIRLSLMDQQATHHESVILDFDIPINADISIENTNTGPAISPIISSPISSNPLNPSSIHPNPPSLINNTDEENDEELQMVLRLSLLDK